MGTPAEPSIEDRKKRVQVALLELDAVTNDKTSPFERELQRYTHLLVTESSAADAQRQDIEMMFFAMAQEVVMLNADKRQLERDVAERDRLLATRRSSTP